MIQSVAGGHSNSNKAVYGRAEQPPLKQEKVEVDASHTPATIEIRTRNVDMQADWDSVREEIGYLGPTAQMKEITANAQSEMLEGITERVHAGRRARDFHKEPGNIFGKLAFEKFLADRQTAIRLDAAPKFGVKIDVRVYPPEISVDTNIKAGTNLL